MFKTPNQGLGVNPFERPWRSNGGGVGWGVGVCGVGWGWGGGGWWLLGCGVVNGSPSVFIGTRSCFHPRSSIQPLPNQNLFVNARRPSNSEKGTGG